MREQVKERKRNGMNEALIFYDEELMEALILFAILTHGC
jgi:hypothetical protein